MSAIVRPVGNGMGNAAMDAMALSGTATAALPRKGDTDAQHAPSGADTPRKRAPRPRRGQLLVLPSARTGEGRRLREFRQSLIDHVGGRPSAPQACLIDRAAVLQHHLTTFDRKAAADGGLSDHASRQYLAWQNTLTRTLVALGLKAAPAPRRSFLDKLRDQGRPDALPRVSGPPGPVQARAPATPAPGLDVPA